MKRNTTNKRTARNETKHNNIYKERERVKRKVNQKKKRKRKKGKVNKRTANETQQYI